MEDSIPGEGSFSAAAATVKIAVPAFVVEIPVQRIEPNPAQPRIAFSDTELSELAGSIREHGVLQPLLVVRAPLEPGQPERFVLVAGERRWRAAQQAGLATVPCLVRDGLSDRERLEVALVENVQRQDLNPIEEACAYRRLSTEFGLTHAEIARRVGKSRPVISNAVRLLDLPEPMQESLARGEISYGGARALCSVTDPVERQVVFEKMRSGDITSKDVEHLTRARRPRARAPKPPNVEILDLERKLSHSLGAPVRIKPLGSGGVIEIDYFSADELSGILGRVNEERDDDAGLPAA